MGPGSSPAHVGLRRDATVDKAGDGDCPRMLGGHQFQPCGVPVTGGTRAAVIVIVHNM